MRRGEFTSCNYLSTGRGQNKYHSLCFPSTSLLAAASPVSKSHCPGKDQHGRDTEMHQSSKPLFAIWMFSWEYN
jgi:hypothetical protein